MQTNVYIYIYIQQPKQDKGVLYLQNNAIDHNTLLSLFPFNLQATI